MLVDDYIKKYTSIWDTLLQDGVQDTPGNQAALQIRLWNRYGKTTMVDLYDKVYNAAASGASLQDLKNELTGVSLPALQDAYEKAVNELGTDEFEGPKDETSPVADDIPKEGSHVSQNELTDALAVRIIEQLALVQSASADELASNLGESLGTVRVVARNMHGQGLLTQASKGRAKITPKIAKLLAELVHEDGFSLAKAAAIVKESTDSLTEDVDTTDSIQEAVPFSSTDAEPDPGAQGETAPAVDLIDVAEDTEGGIDDSGVSESVSDLPDASVDPEPDPGADGVTAPAVDDVSSVQDSVPFDSAHDGEIKESKSLSRIIRRKR